VGGAVLAPLLSRHQRLDRALDFLVPLLVACWTVAVYESDLRSGSGLAVRLLVSAVLLAGVVVSAILHVLHRQPLRLLPLATPGLLAFGLLLLVLAAWSALNSSSLPFETEMRLQELLKFGCPLVVAVFWVERPLRFGLALAGVLLALTVLNDANGFAASGLLHRERSFFGIHRVETLGHYRRLLHGTTLHGMQDTDPERRAVALTYYHATGPVGEGLAVVEGRQQKPPLAVIGLGAGTMAAYAKAGQELTFYEIDPAMVRTALNPEFFTYYSDAEARGARLQIVVGDGRVQLARAPDQQYGLIVVDAFSSDAIPVHLLTREALQLYMKKLSPGGLVALHISNRYLDLQPVVANLAVDAGLHALRCFDTDDDPYPGKNSSDWVLVARHQADFGPLRDNPRWIVPPAEPKKGLWTDDFSNLLSVYRWR